MGKSIWRRDRPAAPRHWIAALVLIATGAFGTAGAQVMTPVAGDPVTIDAGRIAGTMVAPTVKAYYGVPFAAPPVRGNRWRAPQPAAPWTGIYAAAAKRAECVQGLRSSDINHYFGEEDAAEDCLYLNLWAPAAARRGERRPVIVWIYGGGFTGGSASSPIYAGTALAAKGAIVVAANYRLGVFGFLAHPLLTRESGHGASGNWGFLDQVAALQWVHCNIAAFGGDPDNVTLVGQSAGSMSINNLQASPLAKGLFRRVLGMSGATVAGGIGLGAPLAEAEAQGATLQAAMGAADLAAMRAASSDKVVAIAARAGVRAMPDIDGWYLPEPVDAIFAAGRQNDVGVVTGSTANDLGTSPPVARARSLAEYRAAAREQFGADADRFLALWPAATDAQARAQAAAVGEASGAGIGARSWARRQATTGTQPSYLYLFTKVQPFIPGVRFADFDPATAGAYHMGDVPYFLGTYDAFNLFRPTRDWTPQDRALSNRLQDVLIAYARTGVPAADGVAFARYDPRAERRTTIGETVTTTSLDGAALDFLFAHPQPPPSPAAPPSGAAGAAPPSSPRY